MKKVAVVGASGMLGSMVVDYLSKNSDFDLVATVRDREYLTLARAALAGVTWVEGSCDHRNRSFDFSAIRDCDWIINAIGITKPLIHDDNYEEVERAIWVNGLLPPMLAGLAAENGASIIQIATDCVYTGAKGSYVESDLHDCIDVYGKTKSLGETWRENVFHIRCSIIGPEVRAHRFLLDWFLRQPQGAEVKGFTNHEWNGVTTLQFARICRGIIDNDLKLSHLQHLVPADRLSKNEMLKSFARSYNRGDISIKSTEAAITVDRTLATEYQSINDELWQAAGYKHTPGVTEMISETAAYQMSEIVDL